MGNVIILEETTKSPITRNPELESFRHDAEARVLGEDAELDMEV